MSSPVVDHDAAMRIADRWEQALSADGSYPDSYTLARAYKDVVRDALTPTEMSRILSIMGRDNRYCLEESEPELFDKCERIAARAATTKEADNG